jgi:hypothetical protein
MRAVCQKGPNRASDYALCEKEGAELTSTAAASARSFVCFLTEYMAASAAFSRLSAEALSSG